MNMTKKILVLLSVAALTAGAWAQDSDKKEVPQGPTAAQTLEELLKETQRAMQEDTRENQQRIAEFKRERDHQAALLAQAKAQRQALEKRSDELKAKYDENERQLEQLSTVLNEREGNLGEMFGVVRQVAGDIRGVFQQSLVSAQIPGREAFLGELAQSKALPTINELERLWYEIQREITETGKVQEFTTTVLDTDGVPQPDQKVVRVGVFNAVEDGDFLDWNYDANPPTLQILSRQPAGRYQGMAEDLQDADQGEIVTMALDPTRGAILSRVVETPSWRERLDQGGIIGYVIMILGAAGLGLVVYRYMRLNAASRGINQQLQDDKPHDDNPLGRVMMVYTENKSADVETLELKLDEAILRETGPLEKGLGVIKVIYVIAPLLGLLGTVVGMIETFQMITLFGTGDPRMMAGGISKALVTTMQGLVVAIPLTFLHSVLAAKSREMIHILEEQAAGVIALMAERRRG